MISARIPPHMLFVMGFGDLNLLFALLQAPPLLFGVQIDTVRTTDFPDKVFRLLLLRRKWLTTCMAGNVMTAL